MLDDPEKGSTLLEDAEVPVIEPLLLTKRTKRTKRIINLQTRYDQSKYINEAGVDEVARGCLFGPVYAGAVILDPSVPVHEWLNDSKQVTPKRRAVVRKWIEETALAWGVGYATNKDIDRIGIGPATMQAMNMAIAALKIRPDLLLVDGTSFIGDGESSSIPYVTIVDGDAKYASIAAASIVAKEHHDDFVRTMISREPELQERYHIVSNVGYHSPAHRQGLLQHGASKYHRMSFLTRILPQTTPIVPLRPFHPLLGLNPAVPSVDDVVE